MISYLNDKNIWTIRIESDEEINNRQKKRGLVTSLITSFFSLNILVIMLSIVKGDSATYQALISIICIGIFGFILDNSFATENGVKVLLYGIENSNKDNEILSQTKSNITIQNFSDSLKFGYGSIFTPKILRYFIVSFLDIFISLIITDSFIWVLHKQFNINRFISDSFAMIIVAIVTFLTYSNATRLEWAYPAVDEFNERSALIPTSTILLAVVISSIVFLIWKPLIFNTSRNGLLSNNGKITLVSILFIIIIITYYLNFLDPILKLEIKNIIIPCSSQEINQIKLESINNGLTKAKNNLCVESKVIENDIPTIKEIYDNGNIGFISFLVLSTICVMIVYCSSNKNNKLNFIISSLVIIILLLPGFLSFF